MNKWRLLLFSVFGLLQITTSDRNFIDGRCCEHSFRYSEPDTRISLNEPNYINRISPAVDIRKSLETQARTRAKESSFSRRDINSREHLRRTDVDHQRFEKHRMRESTNDPLIAQRRDSFSERDSEFNRIKRDRTRRERSVKNGDRVFRRIDSRSEASWDNNRHTDERQRFGKNEIRQDGGFEYRRRFADDRMSANRKSENNPQKLERRISDTSHIEKRFDDRNTMTQHLFNDEARKIKNDQSKRSLENREVRNTRNKRFVREYRNKEDSFIQKRIMSRNNKNDFVLNTLQERRINNLGLTERNIHLKERSEADKHLNYVPDIILGNVNTIRNNRQRVTERKLIMSRGSISEEAHRYREKNRERERTQKNINEKQVRVDSRNTNSEDLRRNRNLNFETRRDNYEKALENSDTTRVTRRAATMRDLRDDVRDNNRENRFFQRTSQIRRQDTRLETSNMIEKHIRNSRESKQIQERDGRNFKESRNTIMIEKRDNGQFKVQADASLDRRVINIYSDDINRVHSYDRRERNFIRNDIRHHRQQYRESSRMRINSASIRNNADRATYNIDEQLRQTNTQEGQDRHRDRAESRDRNIRELQRVRSRSLEERIKRQVRDISVRSNKANSNDLRYNNLDERQVNLYWRDNSDESRKLSVRLSHMENHEEHRGRFEPTVERLSIRQNYINILTPRSDNLPNRYATTNSRDNVRDEIRSGDTKNTNRYSRNTQARQNIRRDNRDESRIRSVRVLSKMEDSVEDQSKSRRSLERLSIRQNDRNILESRSTESLNCYATTNSRDNLRDEVNSGDTEKTLNRYSRNTLTRQNIKRYIRDGSRIRSVRLLSDIENRKEYRSSSQPPLERLRIRENDRNILRSRSVDLPNRYTRNSRDNVRDDVRSGDTEKSLSYRRATDVVRTRSIPNVSQTRTNKNNEKSRRTAIQNTLRRRRRIRNEEFKIDSTRSPQTFISQNRRNDEESRRIRSRSLTTERPTRNRQVRMNRDRSLNERSTQIEHDDERRDTRRVHLIAPKRSTLFAENMRDIPTMQKTTTSYMFEMKWQYIFYALQGIYICSLLFKMSNNQGEKQLRITTWLTPVNYMKID